MINSGDVPYDPEYVEGRVTNFEVPAYVPVKTVEDLFGTCTLDEVEWVDRSTEGGICSPCLGFAIPVERRGGTRFFFNVRLRK